MKNNRIATVTYTNLKGCTATHELPELAAVVAPNGTGKTALKDAIQLALTGSHPDFGKTGKALMGLASGPDLRVGLTFTDGTVISRQWTLATSGAVKATATIPEAWPADDMGLAFNPTAFVALNDADRVKALLGMGGKLTTTPATPEVEALRDTLEEKGTGASRVTVSELDPFSAKLTDPAAFLEVAEAELVESRKAHKRDVKRLETTVKGLEDAAMGAEAPPKVTAEEVAELAAEGTKLAEEISRLTERRNNGERLRRRMEEIGEAGKWTDEDDADLVRLTEEAARLNDFFKVVDSHEEAIQRRIALCPEPEEVEEALEQLKAPVPEAPPITKESLEAEVRTNRRKYDILTHEIEQAGAEISKLKEQMEMRECPTCKATGDDLHARLVETLQPYLESAVANRAKAVREKQELDAGHDRLAALIEQWEAHYKAKKLVKKAQELVDYDARVTKEIEGLRQEIKAAKAKMQPDPNVPIPDIAEISSELAGLQKRFNQVKALRDLGEVPDTQALEQLAEHIKATTAQRDANTATTQALGVKLRAWNEWGAQEGHVTRTREELAIANGKLETVAELITATKHAANAMAAKIAGPLGRGLRYFTDGILPGKVEVDQNLNIYLETDDRGRREFRALSGSEKAVVGFALAATLAERTPAKVAVIDEASTMDGQRKHDFLKRVAEAVADGVLAQAIVLDHDGAAYNGQDFDIVKI